MAMLWQVGVDGEPMRCRGVSHLGRSTAPLLTFCRVRGLLLLGSLAEQGLVTLAASYMRLVQHGRGWERGRAVARPWAQMIVPRAGVEGAQDVKIHKASISRSIAGTPYMKSA